MKIVCLSDTHTLHRKVKVPEGDILIHAGDICHKGRSREVIEDFDQWLGELPHPYKIVVAGNHDLLFETEPTATRALLTQATYLEDESLTIEGIKIWGSPVTPYFLGMGFNRKRGGLIRQHWEKIPPDVDLLITHGPPRGILDRTAIGIRAGCRDLAECVARIRPRMHLFGHIHERRGQVQTAHTLFVNACIVNVFRRPVNAPVVVDWQKLRD
ncbi:MAG: hypothetical protein OHK0053_01720 [Microscillaceae bacterium]